MVFQSKFWSISKMKIKTSMLWSTDETRLITCCFPTFPQGAQIRRPRPSAPRFGDIGWKRFWHRCSTTFNSTINILNNTNVASDTSISWFCSLLLWEDVLPKLDRKRQVHHTHSTHSCNFLSKGHFSILCGSISLHLCPIQSTIQIPDSQVEPPTRPSPNSGPKHYPPPNTAVVMKGRPPGVVPVEAHYHERRSTPKVACPGIPAMNCPKMSSKKHGWTSQGHVWKSPQPRFHCRKLEKTNRVTREYLVQLRQFAHSTNLTVVFVGAVDGFDVGSEKIRAVSLSFIVILNQCYCCCCHHHHSPTCKLRNEGKSQELFHDRLRHYH